MKRFKIDIIIDGPCSGNPIIVDRKISFFGEVDPYKGVTIDGIFFKDKVLIIPGTRGSTVGSYIIYALKEYDNAPRCIITRDVEPILIVGCMISNIPVFRINDYEDFINYIRMLKKSLVRVYSSKGEVVVYEEGKRVPHSH